MLKDRLRRLFLGREPVLKDQPAAFGPKAVSAEAVAAGTSYERHSHGLEQFSSPCTGIRACACWTWAAPASPTSPSSRTSATNFIRTPFCRLWKLLGSLRARGRPLRRRTRFVDQTLGFPEAHFDGVLLWDALEFLLSAILKATVDRLFKIVKPGGYMLVFFHADEKSATVPVYSYRISSANTLHLTHREMRRPVQRFNNRGVEKLFQRFRSVKFFLARDNLREIVVRR